MKIRSTANHVRPKVHVVYEYAIDYRPHSSSCLRLIRPFLHPGVTAHIDATFDLTFHDQPADLVILDRLWRPDVTLPAVERLVERVRAAGAKFIYSLDDNFFDLILENKGWPPPEFLPIVEFCLLQADGVMVSTSRLKESLQEFVPSCQATWVVLPNALDESLLVRRRPPAPGQRVVIGAMGTVTHDEDLMMILPALQAVCQRHPGEITFQIVGVTRQSGTRELLKALPVRYLSPCPEEQEYPLFMPWFTANLHWDIALSPLRETPFNVTKSDIKFLDYAAIGAAGIFSQLPPYQSSVQHFENGWLAENTPTAWEEALEILVTDTAQRVKIARNAIHYLYNQRILARRAVDWVAAVQTWLGENA